MYDMRPRLCPHHKELLARKRVRDVEVDVCPACLGVFVERGELEKLLPGFHSADLRALARKLLPGAPACDRDGKATARGKVDDGLLARLLDDPFFKRPPPKSTGREAFGAPYLEMMLREGKGLSPEDLLATAATLVAETVAAAVRDFLDTHRTT